MVGRAQGRLPHRRWREPCYHVHQSLHLRVRQHLAIGPDLLDVLCRAQVPVLDDGLVHCADQDHFQVVARLDQPQLVMADARSPLQQVICFFESLLGILD